MLYSDPFKIHFTLLCIPSLTSVCYCFQQLVLWSIWRTIIRLLEPYAPCICRIRSPWKFNSAPHPPLLPSCLFYSNASPSAYVYDLLCGILQKINREWGGYLYWINWLIWCIFWAKYLWLFHDTLSQAIFGKAVVKELLLGQWSGLYIWPSTCVRISPEWRTCCRPFGQGLLMREIRSA